MDEWSNKKAPCDASDLAKFSFGHLDEYSRTQGQQLRERERQLEGKCERISGRMPWSISQQKEADWERERLKERLKKLEEQMSRNQEGKERKRGCGRPKPERELPGKG